MGTRNWGSIGFWATLYKNKQPSLESPFKLEPLTEKSIYIWSEIGAPKHSGIVNGQWNWFPKPEALAGFLRFIELPMYFGIWLIREEWDPEPNRFRRAEELLSLAEISDQCRFKFEIPDMKDLIYQLDTLFDLPDDQIRSGLKDVAKDFNEHWSDTATWHFKLLILDTATDVGKEIFKRTINSEGRLEMSEKDWMRLCSRVSEDQTAQAEFKEVLAEKAWF